jgi:membrane-associated HD superfamily phosphohydrolase
MWDIYMSRTSDLEPEDATVKKSINILSGLLDDKFIKNISPRRYIYYQKFINSLNDKEGLRRFMYTLKKIKDNKDSNDKLYKKIVNLTDQLAKINLDTPNYNSAKKEKLKLISDRVLRILKDKTNKYSDTDNKDELIEDITTSFLNNNEKVGGAINTDNTIDDSNDYLDKYSRKIENILNNKTDKEETKISKYKDILNEIDNVVDPIKTLNITKEDKILFIILTFIIRIITLTIVNWTINNNNINTFENAIILYSFIYLLLIFIIVMIVNITYKYGTNDVMYGNTGFSFLANSLYYFYLIPGGDFKRNGRIFIHSLFLIIFSLIPLVLKPKQDNKIDYDFKKKREVINLVNRYTFVVWIFTSIVAINY